MNAHGNKVVRGLWIGLAVIGAIVLIIVLWLYVGPDTPTQKKDFIQAVGILLAGLVGLGGLFFTWKNLNQTRQTTQRTLELTEKGQITERFTRAIDQLGEMSDDGNPRLEVRLGGIYALERIDKESLERAYHSTVMEVLTAYVRENAPWSPDKGTENTGSPIPRSLRTDVAAILAIIRRREEDRVPEKHRIQHLDLRDTDLRGSILTRAHLEKANLIRTHLEGANLAGAHLERAILVRAHLKRAALLGAHLEGADLREAHLEGAALLGAHLEGANLAGAHLEGAILVNARLEGANLRGAHLKGADLVGAHLEGAILVGAVELTPEQIKRTVWDERTRLPEHLAGR